jgi:hypothetical protein
MIGTFQTDEKGRRFIPDHFIYVVRVSALAAGASASASINIEANSDFVWVKTCYNADVAGAAQNEDSRTIPLVRASITDSGSGVNLQNSPVPVSAMAGHEGLPQVLSQPRTFSANSNVSFTFSNYSAATTYANLEVSLIGYRKLFM